MKPYDLSEIPFSLAGSFLTLSSLGASIPHRIAYRTASAKAVTRQSQPCRANDFFEIALTRAGLEVPYTWSASPSRLDLFTDGDGSASFVFADDETILFETRGVDLRLLPAKRFNTYWQHGPDQIQIIDHSARGIHHLRAGKGTILNHHPSATVFGLDPIGADLPLQIDFSCKNGCSGALRFGLFENQWTDPLPLLDEVSSLREGEYAAWQQRMPRVSERYLEPAEQAWFLLWSCQVPAGGALTRPAVYMSKFWMNAIWAWDNCFNALAIARADPNLAWQQLLLFFDHQNPAGMVPDMINDLEAIYAFTKPPIHGWTIRKLIQMLGLKTCLPYLEKIYKPLSRLVEWWYTQRDYDRDGMPQYHHGNDSGWDNATLFDQGYPTEGADLAAFLVLQCETLGIIADALGKPKAAARWRERGRAQIETLLVHSLKDGRFISPLDGKNDAPETQSLLNLMPIVLGKRLPAPILNGLAASLQPSGPFLTDWGLATESPTSPKYEPDGYWRGPIWAPSTYLIVDGLIDAGQVDLARTIAERFCDLCLEHPGFWENYDALSGKGLRCPGYSWTASVFLLLAEWLAKE